MERHSELTNFIWSIADLKRNNPSHDTHTCTEGAVVGRFDFPAIVSGSIFDQARKVSAARSVAHAASRKTRPEDLSLYALSGRLFHAHGDLADESAWSVMGGQTRKPRYKRADGSTGTYRPRRTYRCSKRLPAGDCPGFGEMLSGVSRTLRAQVIEARVIVWGLDLLKDPERLADYVETFDREAYGDETGEAVQKAQAVIDRAADAKGSILSLIRAGHYTEAEAAADLAEIEAERAEAYIDQHQAAMARAESVRYSVEALRTLEIRAGLPGEIDPEAPEWVAHPDGRGETDISDWGLLRSWLRAEVRIEGRLSPLQAPRLDSLVAADQERNHARGRAMV